MLFRCLFFHLLRGWVDGHTPGAQRFLQERVKPAEERNKADHDKIDELRGSPLSVGTLEEIIDENHAIVSTSVGPEYYVGILQLVDKTQLEPGCSVLLHNKAMAIVGILSNDTDPMVSVMKVDQAPTESFADIGGLETQIQVLSLSLCDCQSAMPCLSVGAVCGDAKAHDLLKPVHSPSVGTRAVFQYMYRICTRAGAVEMVPLSSVQ